MASSHLFHGLSGLSPDEQEFVSRFGRGPSVPVPHSTVHGAFENVVDSHPSAIAATFGGKRITYGELDAAANRLATHLIDSGLRPKERVCIVVERSIEMLVGIFAVLKAGCQYVPVDGSICSERALHHTLRDTGSRFALCLPKFEEQVRRLSEQEVSVVALGTGVEDFCSKERPGAPVSSSDGVYAIYISGILTSKRCISYADWFQGTTGQPKGVDVSHENVTNALLLQPGNLGIKVGTKVAHVMNVAFDMGESLLLQQG